MKTAAEDNMVAMYPHCVFGLNPTAGSIDTPLHAFIPAAQVDHMHPIAAIAIAASKDQERLTQEVFGGEVGWVGWQRPGGYAEAIIGHRAARERALAALGGFGA